MTVDDLNAFPDDDIPEDWEEREDGGKSAFSIHDQEGHMVHFEAIGQVADAGATFVSMSDDNNFVPSINQLCR